MAPKRDGWLEIEGEWERCCDVRWRNSCSLMWCMDQSFDGRKDGELNVLCDRGRRCAVMGVPTAC
jgi:hypothetical protein